MKFLSRRTGNNENNSPAAEQISPPAFDEQGAIAAIDTIINGKYDTRITVPGDLGKALQRLNDHLQREAMAHLERTVAFSSRASDAMVAVSRMTDDVRDVGNNSQSMAAAVEEMAASTNQVATASSETSDAAQSAQDVAQQGISQIGKATQAMQNISSVAQTLNARLSVLGEAAGQIEGMAQTIEDISDQTKLLALNATIEAARAGDAGKGFAVVASEVKSLSDQTSKATDHIRERIETLNSEMGEMKQAMDESERAVQEGENIIGEVGQQINGIVDQVSGVNLQMTEIASVLEQQRLATGEISEQISNIANRAARARDDVSEMVRSVGSTEELIERQFGVLENKEVPNYVLHRAKSDHLIWKKKLAEMLAGLSSLNPVELADHHSCRLGKWYDNVSDPAMTADPRFRELSGPHADVHTHGKRAAEAYSEGRIDEALEEFSQMEAASIEVLRLLNELTKQPGTGTAYLSAAE